MIYKDVNAAQR